MALTQISTAGVKDDAVTAGKIPANAVGSSELADNAVDTAAIADGSISESKLGSQIVTNGKIANNAVTNTRIQDNAITAAKIQDQAVTLAKLPHGDGSSDGKFLRANNGADPSFETVSIPAGTTINNNADNRVITGSGTANTLEGESGLTFSGSVLTNTNTSANPQIKLISAADGMSEFHFGDTNDATRANILYRSGSSGDALCFHGYNNTERMRIDSSGNVGINETSPQQQLHVHDDTGYNGILINGNGAPRIAFARGTTTTGEWSAGIDGTNGNNFAITNSNDNTNRKLIISSTATTASGAFVAGGHCTAFGNFVVGTAGNGIDFSATANASNTGASMSSELLDDYEEGSFTPTLNSGTATVTNAKYVRIGAVCWITAHFSNCSDTSSSTAIMIPQASLPFNKSSFTDNINMGNCPNRYFSHSNKDTLMHWSMDGSGIHLNSSNDANGDKAFTSVPHNHIDASYSAFSIAGWYCV